MGDLTIQVAFLQAGEDIAFLSDNI